MKFTTELTWTQYKTASHGLSCGAFKVGNVYPLLDPQSADPLAVRYGAHNYLDVAGTYLSTEPRKRFDTVEEAKAALETEIRKMLEVT